MRWGIDCEPHWAQGLMSMLTISVQLPLYIEEENKEEINLVILCITHN